MKSQLALLLILAGALHAQDQNSRVAFIEKERDAKTASLAPDEVSAAEQHLRTFKDGKYLERIAAGYNGVRAKVGNMVTGGGFAIGPEYIREDLLDGKLTARASAQFSTRGYQKYEAQALLPRLANGKVSLEGIAGHRNYSSLQYYGNGPLASKLAG